MEERFAEPLGLEEFCSVSGLDRYRLTREFARQIGMPPYAYLLKVRLAKAEEAIARGASQTAAAIDAGCADQSHFQRHFKRYYQYTPGDWFAEKSAP